MKIRTIINHAHLARVLEARRQLAVGEGFKVERNNR